MERVLTEKVNLLTAKGYDITIITTDQKGRKPYFNLNHKINIIDTAINFEDDFHLPYWKKAIVYRKKLRRLKKLIEIELHTHKYDFTISLCGKEINFWNKLNTSAYKIAELHFAQEFKTQFISARKSSKVWGIVGKFMTLSFIKKTANLDKLIVLTKSDEKKWKETNSNVVQIYNPSSIVTDQMPDLDTKRFIAVGRLDEQKGFDILIQIWKDVYKTHPDWQLDIYGNGPKHSELKQLIESLELNKTITLKGVSDDIKKEYLSSSGLIMSSRYEGFPLALIEAQSCGLPIIAFNCLHGPSEIVSDGINGFLIPMQDNKLMARKICELIEKPHLRKSFSNNAKINSLKFSADHIIDEWDNLFKNFPTKNHVL